MKPIRHAQGDELVGQSRKAQHTLPLLEGSKGVREVAAEILAVGGLAHPSSSGWFSNRLNAIDSSLLSV